MGKLDVLTEFKNTKNINEIEIFIYKMPIRDINKRSNENYEVVKGLKKINSKSTIIFFQDYIAAFEKVQNWGDIKFIEWEKRTINTERNNEKILLERLLLEDIQNNIDRRRYKGNRGDIHILNPVYNNGEIEITRYFKFDINIDNLGNIFIGFDGKHNFEYVMNVSDDLSKGRISSGDRVKDQFHNINYEFTGVADFTIYDENKYMNSSIVDYYKNRGEEYIVKNLPLDTKVVLVKSKGGVYPYISSRLKKVCKFETLPDGVLKTFNRTIKLKTDEKMKFMIQEVLNITSNCRYIKLDKRNMLAENLGFKVNDIPKPQLLFRDNKQQLYPMYGLQNFGVYDKGKLKIAYFIDPELIANKNELEKVKKITAELETYSKKMGVKLERVPLGEKVDYKSIDINNTDKFIVDLKRVVKEFGSTTIVILKDHHIEKYYNAIKKTFGYYNEIATQCIKSSTLNCTDREKESIFLNVLLGIYSKSGIQPWILKDKLNSDCFIGLDVSREEKVNKAGIVQVVGKDGRVLRSKVIAASQKGEKIASDTLKEIVYEAVVSYKEAYGIEPKHITFHRDGLNREELKDLIATTKNLGIEFDYVEITKGINRRMASFDVEAKKWGTDLGKCYIKDNIAYVCTTKPYEGIGMAQPLRIKNVHGSMKIEDIVNDVYKLTFMHIGAINKIRLPITTYYADLSSTYGNRELIPSNMDTNCLHFI